MFIDEMDYLDDDSALAILPILSDPDRDGDPVAGSFVESFHGKLRDDCLNENGFTSVEDAKTKIETWRQVRTENRQIG